MVFIFKNSIGGMSCCNCNRKRRRGRYDYRVRVLLFMFLASVLIKSRGIFDLDR